MISALAIPTFQLQKRFAECFFQVIMQFEEHFIESDAVTLVLGEFSSPGDMRRHDGEFAIGHQ